MKTEFCRIYEDAEYIFDANSNLRDKSNIKSTYGKHTYYPLFIRLHFFSTKYFNVQFHNNDLTDFEFDMEHNCLSGIKQIWTNADQSRQKFKKSS